VEIRRIAPEVLTPVYRNEQLLEGDVDAIRVPRVYTDRLVVSAIAGILVVSPIGPGAVVPAGANSKRAGVYRHCARQVGPTANARVVLVKSIVRGKRRPRVCHARVYRPGERYGVGHGSRRRRQGGLG